MNSIARVTVIGTGLIGTSVALALRDRGVEVLLDDLDADAVRHAAARGAGTPLADAAGPSDLVVLAVPPGCVAEALHSAQHRGLAEFYTDVASVKAPIIAASARRGCDLATYVPGHPMAGSEQRGPAAARGDIFSGRPWALCPTPATAPEAIGAVRRAVRLVGAVAHELPAEAHDRAAALISHVPHIVSSTLAARLADADPLTLRLAGRGLLDVTRVAAGDVRLWTDILTHNARALAETVESMAASLRSVAEELRTAAEGEHHGIPRLAELLVLGNTGRRRLLLEQGDFQNTPALGVSIGGSPHIPDPVAR